MDVELGGGRNSKVQAPASGVGFLRLGPDTDIDGLKFRSGPTSRCAPAKRNGHGIWVFYDPTLETEPTRCRCVAAGLTEPRSEADLPPCNDQAVSPVPATPGRPVGKNHQLGAVPGQRHFAMA